MRSAKVGRSLTTNLSLGYKRGRRHTELEYDDQAVEVLSRSWRRFLGALEEEFSEDVPSEFNEVVQKINALLEQVFK